MKSSQEKYALARVAEIVKQKKAKLEGAHTQKGKSATPQERAELIRAGKVKCTAKAIHSYTDVMDAFDFSKFDREPVFDKEAYQTAAANLDAEAACITDKLMLGDADEALKLLEAFSA